MENSLGRTLNFALESNSSNFFQNSGSKLHRVPWVYAGKMVLCPRVKNTDIGRSFTKGGQGS